MRIGMVCPYSFDVPGGVQAHVLQLLISLVRVQGGIDLTVGRDPTPCCCIHRSGVIAGGQALLERLPAVAQDILGDIPDVDHQLPRIARAAPVVQERRQHPHLDIPDIGLFPVGSGQIPHDPTPAGFRIGQGAIGQDPC